MNKKILSLIITLLTIPITLSARIGCHDNSHHLTTKQYDYKEDHAVECYCQCADTLGRCLQCGHYQKPRPWTIVKQKETKHHTKQSEFQKPLAVLKKLVKKYKSTKLY